MNSEEKNAKERIILATIELIEKKGINSITTRGIASTANVNSAAINYYFGSKEKLLDEA
ncbi:MAG: TetR family transcriptional regulator, partial [Bacillota bacterium]|nr:TetR family transcriptional regulator [Bacillota bacterium]